MTHNNGAALIACVWVLQKHREEVIPKTLVSPAHCGRMLARTSIRRAKSTPPPCWTGGVVSRTVIWRYYDQTVANLGKTLVSGRRNADDRFVSLRSALASAVESRSRLQSSICAVDTQLIPRRLIVGVSGLCWLIENYLILRCFVCKKVRVSRCRGSATRNHNPCVGGSNPSSATNSIKGLDDIRSRQPCH